MDMEKNNLEIGHVERTKDQLSQLRKLSSRFEGISPEFRPVLLCGRALEITTEIESLREKIAISEKRLREDPDEATHEVYMEMVPRAEALKDEYVTICNKLMTLFAALIGEIKGGACHG
ncbi:MAG: hypothetical protein WCJ37_02535 [Syntrophus sp. (in: bacteria)]